MDNNHDKHGGLELGSAFQPILSFTHGRQVGWEALLRATRGPGRSPVSPEALFAEQPVLELDIAALNGHLAGFPQT